MKGPLPGKILFCHVVTCIIPVINYRMYLLLDSILYLFLYICLQFSLNLSYILPDFLSELKDLTNLVLLDLSSNRFNGSIPVQGSSEPCFIFSLCP